MQPQPPQPAGPVTAVCPRHGLRYDPRMSTGCVRCRRTREESAKPWRMPIAAASLLLAAGLLATPARDAIKAYFAPPSSRAVVVPDNASPEHRRCLEAGEPSLAEAMGSCQQACQQGWGASCRRLSGLCTSQGPAPTDAACAAGPAALLTQACASHDAIACTFTADQTKAQILWRACEGGMGRSCADLAPLCDPGRVAPLEGAPTNGWAYFAPLREACSGGPLSLYERACSRGDWAACERPGIRSAPTPEQFLAMLEASCDRADSSACRRLAATIASTDPGKAAALSAYANALDGCSGDGCASVQGWRSRLSEARPRAQQESSQTSEQLCEQGNVAACWQASEAYATGEGAARDERRVRQLDARSRELLKAGCEKPGASCASGDTLRVLERCQGDDGDACMVVVRTQGGGPSGDAAPLFRRGLRALRAGCEGTRGEACWSLGELTQQGMLPGGETAQVEFLRRGCDLRHGLSCYEMSRRLATGRGVAQDRSGADRLERQAIDRLTPACDRGEAPACRALSEIFTAGRSVPRDEARAALYGGRSGAPSTSTTPSAPTPAPTAPRAPSSGPTTG